VGSPNLQVIYDPVNLLSAKNHARQKEITDEATSLLSERICVVHAKDFTVHGDEIREHPAGDGSFDYAGLLGWVKQQKPGIDILLENTHPDSIERTIAFVREAYARA
ncbi:MAG TPA: TIM barrel protein, partial [Opitutus sp.]|nr:TIM barrel protein [Opitutus sp.]